MTGVLDIAKNLGVHDNVCIRVIDEITDEVVSEHIGHNAATNTLLTGIGQFLMGEALSTGAEMLSDWIPQYISLGTMGLSTQDEDEEGLPTGVGDLSIEDEAERFTKYMEECPGFGSDGYDESLMNDRPEPGLGTPFYMLPQPDPLVPRVPVNCELISLTFPRSKITFRNCLPESRSEIPKTIDVIFSALVSTGALAQFREPGKNYIFISEVGMWSKPTWIENGLNGMLAGYRMCPPNRSNWDMSIPENRKILKENIIRVGVNQIVQVIWKIQLGAIEQISSGDPIWHIIH